MSQYSKNGSYIYNRAVDNTYNQQQQTYKEQEKQAQAEILYYIYSDLQNLINLIQSRKAVLEYFKNDPNHGMITQSNNKLILQLNLSSGIHLDQSQQYQKHPQLLQFLQNERKNAYKILEKVIDNNDQLLNGNQNNNDVISYYLQEYKLRYAKQEFQFNNQFPLQETNQGAKFDQEVLSKIISSIQNVDSQVDQIRKNKCYKVPDSYEIQQKANQYYNQTQLQLKKIFPNPQDNQMKKQDNFQQNQSKVINIGGQCNQRVSEKVQLIDFINCLRQWNSIPPEKQPFHIKNHFAQITFLGKVELSKEEIQWAINFQKQHLLQKLINLHDYFYVFTGYQKQIKGPDTTQLRQIDMENAKTQMRQKKEDKTYIFNTIGFLYFCKDQIEIQSSCNQNYHKTEPYYSNQNQQTNQEYDEDQIYKFYQRFCSYYRIK